MYLIGSRNPNSDYDLVLEHEDIKPSPQIDIAPKELGLLEVCKYYESGDVVETPVGKAKLVGDLGLMLIRRSHLYRPLNFEKHIRAYHKYKEKLFSQTDINYFNILKDLIKRTKALYPDRHPSLKQNKGEFFDDYVTKIYEHDDIHYATCYYDRPIYESLKSNSETVWCEKSKWEQLSHEDKIKCVQEEAFVIAIERFILPNKGYPPKFAFSKAITRICTNLTSGWFRDFAIENWPEISNCNYNFYERFLTWTQKDF